jgi:glycosyltransferase involved in cell wall biosynthesis
MCEQQGIVAHGFVDDIFDVVARSGLYVAPMDAGAGVKNKIMEALAAGVPVATNTMDAEEALPPEASQVVTIRDDPQAFADYVRDVVEDPARWSEHRRKTRRAAEHYFGWRPKRAEFAGFLTEALTAPEAGVDAAPL